MGGPARHIPLFNPGWTRARPEIATLVAAGFGAVVTGLIVGTPILPLGYRNPSAHLVLETAEACVALLAAYLVYGRFLRTHRLQDLLLLQGLLLLAMAGLALTVVLLLVQGGRTGTLDVWLPLVVRAVGVVLIGAAAVFNGPLVHSLTWRWTLAPPIGFIAVSLLVLGTQESRLPMALNLELAPSSAMRPVLVGHPLLIGTQVVTGACYVIAASAFTLQARRGDDELVRWLGPACALAAFARLNYVLYPSIYSDWLYTGDFLRTGFYLLLLVGAIREIRQYWAVQAKAAVTEDRGRLARELHDGVLQELGYIRSEASRFRVFDGLRTEKILNACDRAVDEARQAVEALAHTGDEPLGLVLRRAARLVAERHQVTLELDVDDSVGADRDQRHALVRITREAISNAARHGGAHRIRVELGQDGGTSRLLIRDDGVGFDMARVVSLSAGFGLIGMRQRAESLPGILEIDSALGIGTAVTVMW